ncbi:HAMP domain-containing sensor histidine kinase [Pseudonocardia humida]|uniref:histidine kinase n=1 Tax=Pseudonocardia humida TaxID=2800819 RepID=A0ABT0ZTN8_9PSEU|nr:HAMP domain-containing sensor histidine kinase [Pseudonocardia humida]MCO1654082.1 HAMP domain-containing histidine kinase [Pseudonocardia humida]
MRRRIIGSTVIAVVLAIALFGAPLAIVVGRYLLDDERTELEREANVVALMLAVELAEDDTIAVLPDVPGTDDDADFAFYDDFGRRVVGVGPEVLENDVLEALVGDIEPGDTAAELVIGAPVAHDGAYVGVVRVAAPRTETYLWIGLVWLLMAALGVFAVGAAWLMARRQGARLARPLEQLALAAERLGDGDFSARSPASGIAEIDAVGAALDSTARRIGDTLARERAFSADTSHQLRTPLTGLRLGLEAALDVPADRRSVAGLSAAIATAVATTDRLEQIADDLLQLARDTNRGGALQVGDLLERTRAEWADVLGAAGRPLRLVVAPDLPAAAAAGAAVRQVLAVLLDNATRHGAGAVTVTARDADDAVAVDVEDEGPGVPDSAEPFVRRSRTAGGHGIGLPLARSLAEAEGGRLLLGRRSPPRFTLLLPIATEHAPDA